MNISRKNAVRLASLTAVGAGALAVSPTAAKASVIYTPENFTLTPPTSAGTNFKSIGVTAGFALKFAAAKTTSGSSYRSHIRATIATGSGSIALAVAAAGNTWNQIAKKPGASRIVHLGSRTVHVSVINVTSPFNPPPVHISPTVRTHIPAEEPFYQLFKFAPSGGGTDYGWVSLQEGVNNNSQLALTVKGLAYDNSGALLPAGDTGNVVPEPSPLMLTGLGMLVLGAEGLRRFRAARNAA